MLIEQVVNLQKLKSENLKFRTDQFEKVVICWSVTQWIMIFRGRLLKNSKLAQSMQVFTWL